MQGPIYRSNIGEYIGIMEKKMETTGIIEFSLLEFRVLRQVGITKFKLRGGLGFHLNPIPLTLNS